MSSRQIERTIADKIFRHGWTDAEIKAIGEIYGFRKRMQFARGNEVAIDWATIQRVGNGQVRRVRKGGYGGF